MNKITRKWTEVISRLETAQSSLANLLQKREKYTTEYFASQWARQRELQGKAISQNLKDRRQRLQVLLQLEEQLLDAR